MGYLIQDFSLLHYIILPLMKKQQAVSLLFVEGINILSHYLLEGFNNRKIFLAVS